ncbi:MAG: hypothetical protein ACI87A_003053 [Planctomycetota bacterium]
MATFAGQLADGFVHGELSLASGRDRRALRIL